MNHALIEIIKQVLVNNDLPLPENFHENLHLQNDLGMDSLSIAELSVRIEDHFDIDIYENGMINTIGDIYLTLQK